MRRMKPCLEAISAAVQRAGPNPRHSPAPVGRVHRGLAMAVATGTIAATTAIVSEAVIPDPLHAVQSRFRVLVPDLEAREGARRGFGEDVAERLRDLIDDMDTHASVDPREVERAADRFGLDEDELDCVQWRQLAVQMNVEIVFCGGYTDGDAGRSVEAAFHGARSGDPFVVPPFSAAGDEEAAATIHVAFRDYVDQLRAASICVEYVGSQQWQAAIDSCDAALAINPGLTSALYARGRAYLGSAEEDSAAPGREGWLRSALADLDAVLEIRPAHTDALQSAGYVATLLGDGALALGYYRRLLELDPANTDVRVRVALDLANNGDPMLALALVEEGIPHAPDDLTLRRYAGHFATAAGQLAAAADTTDGLDRPSDEGPVPADEPPGDDPPTEEPPGDDARAPDPSADDAPGVDLPRDPRSAEEFFAIAARHYEEVRAVAPDSLDALSLRRLTVAYDALGRGAEAAPIVRPALDRFPDDAPLRIALANLLHATGDLDAALALMEEARGIDPAAARYDLRTGSWLLEAGREEEASARFRAAVDSGEATGDVIAQLLFARAIRHPYAQRQWSEAVPLLTAAAEWAETAPLASRIHFFTGYALLQWGIATEDGETAAAARRALPLFQRARDHLQRGRDAEEARGRIGEILGAVAQYIDIQETLIRRGR